nr:SPOR domain-containing protein [Metabacillus lacus]
MISSGALPAEGSPAVISVDGTPALSEDAASGEKEAPAAGAGEGSYQSHVVQLGKYSSKEGADAVAAKMKDSGFAAAVFSAEDAYFVYGGVAKEKAITDSLSTVYSAASIEAWGGKNVSLSYDASQSELIQQFEVLSSASAELISGGKAPDLKASVAVLKDAAAKSETAASLLAAAEIMQSDASQKGGWKAQQLLLETMQVLQK